MAEPITRVDIEERQRKVIEFRDARDWAQYHIPKDLTISLSLEAEEEMAFVEQHPTSK
jgi:NTP pyrophosphatase (non-canonical NTP hydrolase)